MTPNRPMPISPPKSKLLSQQLLPHTTRDPPKIVPVIFALSEEILDPAEHTQIISKLLTTPASLAAKRSPVLIPF